MLHLNWFPRSNSYIVSAAETFTVAPYPQLLYPRTATTLRPIWALRSSQMLPQLLLVPRWNAISSLFVALLSSPNSLKPQALVISNPWICKLRVRLEGLS